MKVLVRILQWVLILLLPFYILVRLSLLMHVHVGAHAWLSLAGGMIGTIFLIALYSTIVASRVSRKLGTWSAFKRRTSALAFLVGGFCLYALVLVSAENVKHDAVLEEFRSLHPVLRLGVGTIVLFDKQLIVTDASRHPDDYQRMGLPGKSRSLHFPQSSGYVHAVDIRTNERSRFRNALIRLSFRLMGFNTLRHVGTADHLHISLESRDLPGAI